MFGPSCDDIEERGMIPRMLEDIFANVENSSSEKEFRIKLSMYEIYMEKIQDLLDPNKGRLKIRESQTEGVFIENITEVFLLQPEEFYQVLSVGETNRTLAQTQMNQLSSRSHCVVMITISQSSKVQLGQGKTGKLFLVDLAGSEKVSKSGAEGKVLNEAKKINLSLSSLGNVINALTDEKTKHIPYRDSKLTRLLQDSLGGNSKTKLIITCSPASYNEAETLSTLRFGTRAKSIKNKPKVNRELGLAELKALLQQAEGKLSAKDERIRELEEQIKLMGAQPLPNAVFGKNDSDDETEDGHSIDFDAENNSLFKEKCQRLMKELVSLRLRNSELEVENEGLMQKITDPKEIKSFTEKFLMENPLFKFENLFSLNVSHCPDFNKLSENENEDDFSMNETYLKALKDSLEETNKSLDKFLFSMNDSFNSESFGDSITKQYSNGGKSLFSWIQEENKKKVCGLELELEKRDSELQSLKAMITENPLKDPLRSSLVFSQGFERGFSLINKSIQGGKKNEMINYPNFKKNLTMSFHLH